MTSLVDPAARRRNTRDVALDWLACGLDPKRSVLWRQSDVPEVTELNWILGTLTPMGLLERAHSYKDKTAKGIAPNFGLFAYPVLMAADILLYDTNVVPVGRDQKQHLEMTRDIAIKFNQTYGETFVVPEPDIREDMAVVPGLDGQKMSKSHGNTIELFGEEKALRKKIMGIVMDSRTPAEPKPDAEKNLAIQLLKLVAPVEVATDFENRLRAGGLGYGDLKKALFEHYWNHFAAARARSWWRTPTMSTRCCARARTGPERSPRSCSNGHGGRVASSKRAARQMTRSGGSASFATAAMMRALATW
jgi:tryptophanyl-tRNA synthetase